MLTDIEISGFQGHKDSSISLGPKVNVIIGESDSGKSSIVRLLEWIFKNRPKGESFRNSSLGKKDLVSGSVAFDDGGWITRTKGGKTNQYEIESGVLKALRMDVPGEVSEVSKIQDVNMQSQHPSEQYFMLTESPGQVAKQFNKVIGLTIMDDALISINGKVRTTKHKCDFTNESIKTHKKQIEDLDWTQQATLSLEYLEKEKKVIDHKIKKSDALLDIVEEYDDMAKKYAKLKGLTQARKDLIVLFDQAGAIDQDQSVVDNLLNNVEALKMLDKKLVSTTTLKNAVNEIPALFSLNDAQDEMNIKRNALTALTKQIKRNQEYLDDWEIEIADIQKEWDAHAGEECPICGGEL